MGKPFFGVSYDKFIWIFTKLAEKQIGKKSSDKLKSLPDRTVHFLVIIMCPWAQKVTSLFDIVYTCISWYSTVYWLFSSPLTPADLAIERTRSNTRFFLHTRARISNVNLYLAKIRTNLKLDGYPADLSVWCRSVKIKGTIHRIRSNTGFLNIQWHIIPKWIYLDAAKIRTHLTIYSCRAYLPYWWRSAQNYRPDKVKAMLFFFFYTQGHITLKWIIKSGRNSNSSEILWLS